MLDRELSVKGWNWGVANFNGSVGPMDLWSWLYLYLQVLNFEVGKHDAFEVPLAYVQHCQAQKNEVRRIGSFWAN